jgi:hypothetical protein
VVAEANLENAVWYVTVTCQKEIWSLNTTANAEFLEQIKNAVAVRLAKRLGRVESGCDGWQGTAWILERLYPTRFSKPEVQIQMNSEANASGHQLTITISMEEAQRLQRESERSVATARKLIEEYQQRRNGSTEEGVEATAT